MNKELDINKVLDQLRIKIGTLEVDLIVKSLYIEELEQKLLEQKLTQGDKSNGTD